MTAQPLDLGDGHFLFFVGKHGFDGHWGASVSHPDLREPTRECGGFITFDGPDQRAEGAHAFWTVNSWEPLDLAPSLLCPTCGDHGFVRNGRWVRA